MNSKNLKKIFVNKYAIVQNETSRKAGLFLPFDGRDHRTWEITVKGASMQYPL